MGFQKLREIMLIIGIGLFIAIWLIIWFISTINARQWAVIENKITQGIEKTVTVTETYQKSNTAKETFLTTFQWQLWTQELNNDLMIYAINQTYDDVRTEWKINNKNNQLIEQLWTDDSIKLVIFPSKWIVVKENKDIQALTFSKKALILWNQTFEGKSLTDLDNRLKGYSISATAFWPFTDEEAEIMIKKYFPHRMKYPIENSDKYLIVSDVLKENWEGIALGVNSTWGTWKVLVSITPTSSQNNIPSIPNNQPKPVSCSTPDEYQVKLPDGTCVDALYLDDNWVTVKANAKAFSKYDIDNNPDNIPIYAEPWKYYKLRDDNQSYYLARNAKDVAKMLETDPIAPNRIVTTLMLNFEYQFRGKTLPNNWNIDISNWDTSNVATFSGAFKNSNFNGDINDWDVGFGKHFDEMFRNNNKFNKPLNKWKFGKHIIDEKEHFPEMNFNQMFQWAKRFNQDINSWDVSRVYAMNEMFAEAQDFNKPLNNWKLKKLNQMSWMFKNALAFNQPLNKWDMRKVSQLQEVFSWAKNFNQNLKAWDLKAITEDWQKRNFDYNTLSWETSNKPLFKYIH